MQPHSSYVVCATPRSGSWLLCGLLASTGLAGRPHEWFWRDFERTNRRDWGVTDFAGYLAGVRAAGTTPNGIFGAKLMWAYFGKFLVRLNRLGGAPSGRLPRWAHLGRLPSRFNRLSTRPRTGPSVIARHFPDPHFVWIRRDDITAQAVSFAKATQTGRWHYLAPHGLRPAPIYDHRQIDALISELAAHDAAWDGWFAANEIEPFTVRYEDLVADPNGVTRRVLEFLEIDSTRVPIAELTVRMGDSVNAEWLCRYLGASDVTERSRAPDTTGRRSRGSRPVEPETPMPHANSPAARNGPCLAARRKPPG